MPENKKAPSSLTGLLWCGAELNPDDPASAGCLDPDIRQGRIVRAADSFVLLDEPDDSNVRCQVFELDLQDHGFAFVGFDSEPNQIPWSEWRSSELIARVVFMESARQVIRNAFIKLTR